MDILECRIREEELVDRERSRESTQSHCHPQDHRRRAPALFSETQESARRPSSCCYCQLSHAASECQVVKDLDARRQILKTHGRCFDCLVRGHVARMCRSTPQCPICKRKHHPSICNQRSADLKSLLSLAEPTHVSVSTLNPEDELDGC